MKISPLLLVIFAICACDGGDTRVKRVAAIEEVEHFCGLPPNTFDMSLADKPASEGRACTGRESGKTCRDVRFIQLGYAVSQTLICKMQCVKGYKSKNGYGFGLYLNSFTPKDAPRCMTSTVAENNLAVARAKEVCAGKSNEFKPEPNAPPVGGNSEFTKCMLQQANLIKGQRSFEQVCAAIPGGRSDSGDGNCFVVHF